MSEYVLRTNGVYKAYNNINVLEDINMEVKKGQIYGFMGKNGAGKTTLMKIICSLAYPTKGTIELFGKISPSEFESSGRIGSIIEIPSIYGNMTAAENLEMQKKLIGIVDNNIIKETLKLVKLDKTGKKKSKTFSLGMKQRLGIGIALINHPDFLVLDEPINGLDPSGIAEIRELLKSLTRERGTTILISSHILSELSLFATNFGIIHEGKLIAQLTDKELNEKCSQYVKIITTETEKAAAVIEQKLNIKKFTVFPNNEIRIYEYTNAPEHISNGLFEEHIPIQGLAVEGQDLESYFMNLTGGIK